MFSSLLSVPKFADKKDNDVADGLYIEAGSNRRFIPYSHVQMIKIYHGRAEIYLDSYICIKKIDLAQLKRMLPEVMFVRIDALRFINMAYIERLEMQQDRIEHIVLKSGSKLAVSPFYMGDIEEAWKERQAC